MTARKGMLLSKTTTTGWHNWVHGELWIFADGLLRIPLGWGKSLLLLGYFFRYQPRHPYEQIFGDAEFERLIARKSVRWIPRDAIVSANLNHALGADELRVTLSGGRKHQLLWIPHLLVFRLLGFVLDAWKLQSEISLDAMQDYMLTASMMRRSPLASNPLALWLSIVLLLPFSIYLLIISYQALLEPPTFFTTIPAIILTCMGCYILIMIGKYIVQFLWRSLKQRKS